MEHGQLDHVVNTIGWALVGETFIPGDVLANGKITKTGNAWIVALPDGAKFTVAITQVRLADRIAQPLDAD